MAHPYGYGGDPNNTSYRTSYPGTHLFTNGYDMPTGNLDSSGRRPIRIFGVGTDWSTGAAWHAIRYRGSGWVGTGIWADSGGTFDHGVGIAGSGPLGAGRNTTNGKTMTDAGDGDTVTGGICGYLSWETAPAAPTILDITPLGGNTYRVRFSGSSDTGGATITGWVLQYATNSSFTGATTIASSGTSDIVLAPGTYWFRAAARNNVVDSLGRYSAWSAVRSYTVAGANRGRRWNGTSWVNNTVARRWNGTAWVDLSTLRRRSGTSWIDISI